MTLTTEDLALTPKQYAELNLADTDLVHAWLEATELNTGLKSPVGWFLAGVRTGQYPANLDDAKQRRAVMVAEAEVRNIGANIETEDELIATLFNPPNLTADIATLERLERETRDSPGRHLYGDTLKAQLKFTSEHGRQQVPHSGGRLARYDTPELRTKTIALWKRHRHLAVVPSTPDDDIPF